MGYEWIEQLNRLSGSQSDVDRHNHRLFTLRKTLLGLSNPEAAVLARRIVGQLLFVALRDSPGHYSGLRLVLSTFSKKRIDPGKIRKHDKLLIVNKATDMRASIQLTRLTPNYLSRVLAWPCGREHPHFTSTRSPSRDHSYASPAEMLALTREVDKECWSSSGQRIVKPTSTTRAR